MHHMPEFVAEPHRVDWLQSAADAACRDRIWQLGLLTGLKADAAGNFSPANFERGLVLDRLLQLHRPKRILEIGTGRGLGCLGMAAAAHIHNAPARIVTLDILAADAPQRWPIEINGGRRVLETSRTEIWSKHIDPALVAPVSQVIGPTTRTLPDLVAGGHRFDLIFIDAGHDLYSVIHDLAYSMKLLAPAGRILMDDFAPMEEFGLGTCIAAQHARRFFGRVEIFPTDGLVFGGAEYPTAPRGMVLLSDPYAQEIQLSRVRLLAWRMAELLLRVCHAPQFFPVRSLRAGS